MADRRRDREALVSVSGVEIGSDAAHIVRRRIAGVDLRLLRAPVAFLVAAAAEQMDGDLRAVAGLYDDARNAAVVGTAIHPDAEKVGRVGKGRLRP